MTQLGLREAKNKVPPPGAWQARVAPLVLRGIQPHMTQLGLREAKDKVPLAGSSGT